MKRRYHLHLPGLAYCGMTLVVALAAMNSQNNLLFWIFGALCSGIVLSGIISGFMMIQIRFKRLDPQYGAVGEPLLVRYALSNRSRILPAFNIHVEERAVQGGWGWQRLMGPAQAWIMHMGPREIVHGEAIFWPVRRGEAKFDHVQLWTTFPFGIVKKSVTFTQPMHTLVYPQLYQLRSELLQTVTPPSIMGSRTTERPGAGDEYFGLREHRETDSIRSIAWKRSAHLDQLICVERSSPSPPKLRIVLNLATPTNKLRVARDAESQEVDARELEERAISLAASVAHAAHHAGYEISLHCHGVDVPSIAMRRSYWHIRKIMGALAAIDLNAPRNEDSLLPSVDTERAGLVVIHPDRVEPLEGVLRRNEALHLTGRQLETLAIKAIGWDAIAATNAQVPEVTRRQTEQGAVA